MWSTSMVLFHLCLRIAQLFVWSHWMVAVLCSKIPGLRGESHLCSDSEFHFFRKKKIVMIKSHTTKFTNLLCCCGCPCCSWWTNCVLTIAKALRNIYRQSPWYSWYSLHSYSTIVYDVELMLSPLHQIRGEHKQSNALSSFVLVRIWCCEM